VWCSIAAALCDNIMGVVMLLVWVLDLLWACLAYTCLQLQLTQYILCGLIHSWLVVYLIILGLPLVTLQCSCSWWLCCHFLACHLALVTWSPGYLLGSTQLLLLFWCLSLSGATLALSLLPPSCLSLVSLLSQWFPIGLFGLVSYWLLLTPLGSWTPIS